MILHIDTTKNDLVAIAVKDKNSLVAKKSFNSRRTQAEKLLPAIEKFLKANKFKLSNLESVVVENRGGSFTPLEKGKESCSLTGFTALRIGVVMANALAYALGIPAIGSDGKAKTVKNGRRNFDIVEPAYNREPEITVKKSRKA